MSDSKPNDCPFCALPPARVLASNTYALALADGFPVSPGHTLIVARRHVPDFFALTQAELFGMIELLREMRNRLAGTLHPDGFNLGVNVGAAAGQTVFHVHLHLIPRFAGDVECPEGGIRNVIPGRGRYGEPGVEFGG
jgi:diadenosine tetraphosphate (Ap4A) HIT family hydrolase